MTVGARMRLFRESIGLTRAMFSERYGISQSTLSGYELGKREPHVDGIEAFIRAGADANWLVSGAGNQMFICATANQVQMNYEKSETTAIDSNQVINRYETGFVAVPLYNDIHAAAGHGALVEHENADDALMFKEDWLRFELGAKASDLCLIRVSGDSMEPTLRGGDVILVNQQITRPDREGIYILRMGEMLLVKRLQAVPGGNLRVISDNAAFDSWVISLADLGVEIAIIGRVVWSGRKM